MGRYMLERIKHGVTWIIATLSDISYEMCLNEYSLTTLQTKEVERPERSV